MYKYQQLEPSNHLSEEDKLVKDLLRLRDEPCIYIGEFQVHEIALGYTCEFMDAILRFYREWESSPSLVNMPRKQLFYTEGLQGDFRVMPCSIASPEDVKSVKIIGTNEENRLLKDKISVGKSLLIDKHDNFVYAILDVCALSSYRTAAVSVLAFSHLAEYEKAKVGLVGLGRIGFYTAYILNQWLGVKKFLCQDVNGEAGRRFSSLMELYLPEVHIEIMDNKEVLSNSDSIFISTDSQDPILFEDNAEGFNFISSVGADAHNFSELHESVLAHDYRIVTDSVHSLSLGDMSIWKDKGLICEEEVMELKTLLNTGHRPEKSIFISTGIALQDALIGKFIADKVLNASS